MAGSFQTILKIGIGANIFKVIRRATKRGKNAADEDAECDGRAAYWSNSSVAWRKSSSIASRSLWTVLDGEGSLTGVFGGASDLCGGLT